MTDRVVDTYSVIHRGKKSLSLHKHGNKRTTRVYKDGMEMTASIGWYLANRDCRIVIHDKNGDVMRVITSGKGQDMFALSNGIPRNEDNCPHEAQARVHWFGRTCRKCAYGRGTPCSYPLEKERNRGVK